MPMLVCTKTNEGSGRRAITLLLLIILSACLCVIPRGNVIAVQKPYDVLLRGGTVVDGSGAVRFRADVAIKGDRIARIDRSGIAAEQAAQVIDTSRHEL